MAQFNGKEVTEWFATSIGKAVLNVIEELRKENLERIMLAPDKHGACGRVKGVKDVQDLIFKLKEEGV